MRRSLQRLRKPQFSILFSVSSVSSVVDYGVNFQKMPVESFEQVLDRVAFFLQFLLCGIHLAVAELVDLQAFDHLIPAC